MTRNEFEEIKKAIKEGIREYGYLFEAEDCIDIIEGFVDDDDKE